MNTVIKTLSLTVLGGLMAIGTAHAAGFAGASSDGNNILIKNTNPVSGPHPTNGNEPGIQVTGADGVFAQALLSFKTYQQFAGNDGSIDNYKISTLNASDMPASHSSLGNFDFAQVPNQEVYFGEWTANRSNPAVTHTVYYGGKDKTTNLPSSGQVTYYVKGINNFNNSNKLLSGNLRANFSNNTLTGTLRNYKSGRRYQTVPIHPVDVKINANIDPNTSSFDGSATHSSNTMTIDATGTSSGQFFGNNGQSLAGIATFEGNRQFDTAFGGAVDNRIKDIYSVPR